MDNFGKAFDLTVDVLSEKVNYFYVFPFFFLKVLREIDIEVYLDFLNDKADLKRSDACYEKRINKAIEVYVEKLDLLEEKSKIIANWVDAQDPLAYFQQLMSQKTLSKFVELKKELLLALDEQIKEGKITVPEALSKTEIPF